MDMSDSGRQPANAFWSGIYAQLSEFFKEPSADFAEDVASGRLARFFEERCISLALDPASCKGLAPAGDVAASLAGEYRRLFRGPLPPYIIPVESVYKKWASDPDCHLPIAQEKGLLMGDSAVDMLRRYREEGIALPDEFSSMPDHVALELEYLSLLSLRGDEDAGREFLARHMDWLDDLVRDIEAAGAGDFYSRGARITRDIVNRAREVASGVSRQ
ncbi:MAG: molecular chaperone TorD family protein [Sulfuritalea sp.]|nr:molecular chaperone TorD family protein [Sulfuritalea sp.]